MKRFLSLFLFLTCLFATKSYAYFGDQLSRIYFHPIHHWVIDFSDSEKTLTLEDGSVWTISSPYSAVNDWHRNDPLTISIVPEGWFSNSYYQITNHNERSYQMVKAHLLKTPILKAEYTRQILYFDDTNRVITLTDRSRWKLTFDEYSKCSNWAVGDCIITGTTRSSWNFEDSVLINTNLNTYLKATLKGYLYGTIDN